MKKILKFLLSFGPGIFAIGYTIGTGSVTSMIVAGNDFGMDLLWVLFFSCLFPVPATDVLHVKNMSKVSSLSIYTMNGVPLLDKNISAMDTEIDLDIASIPTGKYTLILHGEEHCQSLIFVKL